MTTINIRLNPRREGQIAEIEAATGAVGFTSAVDYALATSVAALRKGDYKMCSLYTQAKFRVDHSDILAPHSDFILADWPEGNEHWRWVLEASEEEILNWVEAGSHNPLETDDRVKQVNIINQVALDLTSGKATVTDYNGDVQAFINDCVDFWNVESEDKPSWWDEHDDSLLEDRIKEILSG